MGKMLHVIYLLHSLWVTLCNYCSIRRFILKISQDFNIPRTRYLNHLSVQTQIFSNCAEDFSYTTYRRLTMQRSLFVVLLWICVFGTTINSGTVVCSIMGVMVCLDTPLHAEQNDYTLGGVGGTFIFLFLTNFASILIKTEKNE